MTVPKSTFHGIVDRPDFRYVGLVWEVGQYELDTAPEEPKATLQAAREDREDPKYKRKRVVAKLEGKRRGFYAPLQEPDLFLSFARLSSRGRPSVQAVLRWVQKFGLLHKADKQFDTVTSYVGLNQAPILVKDFAAESLEARAALNLYTDLNREGIEGFRKRLVTLREQADSGVVLAKMDNYMAREWGPGASILSKFDSFALQLMATVTLEGFVKDKLEGVRLAPWSDFAQASWAARYEPTQSWKCPDLMSAMYLQFYLMMTQSLEMRRCQNPACEMPIPVTRKNRRFCNPTCRSNMRHYPELRK